jgi:hypothetical protein
MRVSTYLSKSLVFNGCNVVETEPSLKPDRAPFHLESVENPFSKTILKTPTQFLKKLKRARGSSLNQRAGQH